MGSKLFMSAMQRNQCSRQFEATGENEKERLPKRYQASYPVGFDQHCRRTMTGPPRTKGLYLLGMLVLVFLDTTQAIDLSRLYGHYNKRELAGLLERKCEAFEPFRCPIDGRCISIQYLCDGAPDCLDGYDEDPKLCTAAKRPPVEETTSFLNSLLSSHGPNYLENLFGEMARNRLAQLGGVDNVAIALSESQTIEDFGIALHLPRSDIEHLRSVFMAVENGDLGTLKALGIKDSELADVKFFLEKLVNTGFLD